MKLPDSLFDDPNRLQPSHRDTEPQQPLLREERFDRKGVWRPRSTSQLQSGAYTRQEPPGPSYLYVFAHAYEKRFKIGHSILPLGRLANLPEANQIDHVQSFRLEFPDRRRARQVESMLHKALASFRLELASLNASTFSQQQVKAWDGATEWFSKSGMHHVMDLLRALPESLPAQQTPLETLGGRTYVVDAPLRFQKESDRRRYEARLYNLERLDHICNSVMQIKRHLRISWHDSKSSKDPTGSSVGSLPTGGILRVHGFMGSWVPGVVGSGESSATDWHHRPRVMEPEDGQDQQRSQAMSRRPSS